MTVAYADRLRDCWEYKVVLLETWSLPDLNLQLNKLGEHGWELVSNTSDERSNSNTFLFKRKLRS